MYDEHKVDDVVLALLHLNAFKDRHGWRAWKGHDWDALDRLHKRGLIGLFAVKWGPASVVVAS